MIIKRILGIISDCLIITKESRVPFFTYIFVCFLFFFFSFFNTSTIELVSNNINTSNTQYNNSSSFANFNDIDDNYLSYVQKNDPDAFIVSSLVNDNFNNMNVLFMYTLFITLIFFFTCNYVLVDPVQDLYKKNDSLGSSRSQNITLILDTISRSNYALILLTHALMLARILYGFLVFIYSKYCNDADIKSSFIHMNKDKNDILNNTINKKQTNNKLLNKDINYLYDTFYNFTYGKKYNVETVTDYVVEQLLYAIQFIYNNFNDIISNYSLILNKTFKVVLFQFDKIYKFIKQFKICHFKLNNDFFFFLEMSNVSIIFFYYKIFIIIYIFIYFIIIKSLNSFLNLKIKLKNSNKPIKELFKLFIYCVIIILLIIFSFSIFTRDDWVFVFLFSLFYFILFIFWKILNMILQPIYELYFFLVKWGLDENDFMAIGFVVLIFYCSSTVFYSYFYGVYYPYLLFCFVCIFYSVFIIRWWKNCRKNWRKKKHR